MQYVSRSKKRDLTEAQFRAACEREGFRPQPFMGYFDLGIPGHKYHSSVWNAGPRRRDMLAYLRSARKTAESTLAREAEIKAARAAEYHAEMDDAAEDMRPDDYLGRADDDDLNTRSILAEMDRA